MKFIIFGTGMFYKSRKNELLRLCKDEEIVAFFDNKIQDISYFEGKVVSKPYLASKKYYDKILLMSRSDNDMIEQLLSIGYDYQDIWTWNHFEYEMTHAKYEFFCGVDRKIKYCKRILMVTDNLGYNGSSIAITYAAKCLSVNNEVILAAPVADYNFVKEMQGDGINILIFQPFPYIGKEERYLFKGFDVVIANVFSMLPLAVQVSQFMPVLWWIHEATVAYGSILNYYKEYAKKELLSRINIMAVSDRAKDNFNYYFEDTIHDTLVFGIPDCYNNTSHNVDDKNKMIFAVIGGIEYIKAQDIFINAIEILVRENKVSNVEFWIIGSNNEEEFSKEITEKSQGIANIVIKGQMTREQINKAYHEIDVVVCPSREETMSIVIIEGMMYGKVCIASEATGISDYIDDKINGLVCKKEDDISLAASIEWVIDNPDKCYDIRNNARKTYEMYFTMGKFENRLNQVVFETIEKYNDGM